MAEKMFKYPRKTANHSILFFLVLIQGKPYPMHSTNLTLAFPNTNPTGNVLPKQVALLVWKRELNQPKSNQTFLK